MGAVRGIQLLRRRRQEAALGQSREKKIWRCNEALRRRFLSILDGRNGGFHFPELALRWEVVAGLNNFSCIWGGERENSFARGEQNKARGGGGKPGGNANLGFVGC